MLRDKYIIRKTLEIFEILLDIILPRAKLVRELESLSLDSIREIIPPPRPVAEGWIHSMFDYKNPLAKTLIWQLKYRGSNNVACKLGALLYEEVVEEIADQALFDDISSVIFIPIPLSKKRRRERGFNQTEMLIDSMRKCAGKENFQFNNNVLIKIRDTPKQSHLENKSARLENLKGCFKVTSPEKVFRKNIILIDDVTTTGTTLREARAALLSCGARKVLAFTVAH